jgi:hypothetical protein
MKMLNFQKARLTIIGLATLGLTAGNVLAQDSTTPTASTTATAANPAQPAAVSAPAPQLSYGVSEILQMSQAKVGDNVIISYVQNSGNNYGLNAAQIIYLRQQGVSDGVINTMLNQRTQSAQIAAATTTPPSETPTANSTPSASTTTTQPAVAYVPATSASTVYVVPDTQTYNYNAWLYSRPYPYPYYGPYYGYYPYYGGYCWPAPAISLSFGFGFGGYHNHGYYGGWHGGGGGWHH